MLEAKFSRASLTIYAQSLCAFQQDFPVIPSVDQTQMTRAKLQPLQSSMHSNLKQQASFSIENTMICLPYDIALMSTDR